MQPLKPGFEQRNYMGMNASDYGGGTPVVDIWRRDAGLAVGHVELTPKLVALPVAVSAAGAQLHIELEKPAALDRGQSLQTLQTFLGVHRGDYFGTLVAYRALLAERGLVAPRIPETSYEPIWCAWGYERNFTVEQIVGTLPKVRELGLKWAVVDDGWQTAEGDWKLDPEKFPRGDADMIALVKQIKRAGLRPKLWVAPLAVDPGTDLLHDHPELLLLDRGRRGSEHHLVEQLLSLSGGAGHDRKRQGAGAADSGHLGLRGPQDRRPAPQRRRALLQPRASSSQPRRNRSSSCRSSGRRSTRPRARSTRMP